MSRSKHFPAHLNRYFKPFPNVTDLMFNQLSKSVGKKNKETNKRMNQSVNDLLLGINQTKR